MLAKDGGNLTEIYMAFIPSRGVFERKLNISTRSNICMGARMKMKTTKRRCVEEDKERGYLARTDLHFEDDANKDVGICDGVLWGAKKRP